MPADVCKSSAASWPFSRNRSTRISWRNDSMASHALRYEGGGGVDVAVGGGFEEAAGVDVVLADEVGNGAGDLDEAVDAAGSERAALLDEVGQGALAEAVELTCRALDGAGHLGVAAQAPGAQAGELAVAGTGDAGADRGGGFAGFDGA